MGFLYRTRACTAIVGVDLFQGGKVELVDPGFADITAQEFRHHLGMAERGFVGGVVVHGMGIHAGGGGLFSCRSGYLLWIKRFQGPAHLHKPLGRVEQPVPRLRHPPSGPEKELTRRRAMSNPKCWA